MKSKISRIFAIAVLGCLFAFSGSGLALAKSPVPGDSAPNFSLTSVDGKAVSLSQFQGKVVLVGMFHICVPCLKQAMEFNKVRSALPGDELVILGINTSGDSKPAVLDYLKGFPETPKFPYLLDPEQSVHHAYIQVDMPTVLIIGRDGKLQARSSWVGADQLIAYLKKNM
ncbi:MAG: redoxin family protein [Candidatus Nitrohelix vancouverensis]|uniref:Redoxin family protein n=1 Tax=Candidatus Nitrohelix vancouverensis TaxID=2705534 RepID=A0A7T0G4D8_9BACT|nr:MAG: redoxin family protein [Candidatus Nitrohelix vancouverensis]